MELLQVLKRGLQQVSGHGGLRGYLRVLFRANDVRKEDSGVGPTFNTLQVKTVKNGL
uniref:NADH:ubiquinone oxidoreductase subunit A12 n=1 Tax=Propithecus coquereli TaxID=379532 RepID=A0A2K6G0S8_PROCO